MQTCVYGGPGIGPVLAAFGPIADRAKLAA